MSLEIDFTYQIDGFFETVNYYRSEEPMNTNQMPEPLNSGISGLNFTDTTAEKGKLYYVRFGSVKNNIVKISDEITFIAGKLWKPLDLSSTKVWLNASSYTAPNWVNKIADTIKFTNSNSSIPSLIDNSLLFTDDYLYSDQQQVKDLFKNISKFWFAITLKQNAQFSLEQALFTVMKNTDSSRFYLSINPNTNQIRLALRRLDSDSAYLKILLNQSIGSVDSIIIQLDYEVGKIKYSINGVYIEESIPLLGGPISNTNSTNSIAIGAWLTPDANNTLKDSNIYDIQIGGGNIDEIDRQKLEGWLAHNYETANKLPSNHPFKNSPPFI